MSRRKKEVIEEVQNQENVTPEVTTEENKSEEVKADETPASESVTDENNESVKEDNAEDKNSEESKEESEDVDSENEDPADKVETVTEELSNEEVLQGRISILEHTFDKKVIEHGVYDLYKKGNMWIFKDRNGCEISTHFGEIEVALKLFVVRMYPLDKRARGSSFTWAEIEN